MPNNHYVFDDNTEQERLLKNSNSSVRRKKEKRRNSSASDEKKEKKSSRLSIKKSIRNRLERIKGGKKQQQQHQAIVDPRVIPDYSRNSSGNKLPKREKVAHPKTRPSTKHVASPPSTKKLPKEIPNERITTPPVAKEETPKKKSSNKQQQVVSSTKPVDRKHTERTHKPTVQAFAPPPQPPKIMIPSQRQLERPASDLTELQLRAIARENQRNRFRSYTDSSDSSVTDFDGIEEDQDDHYGSDASSSVFFKNNFSESYVQSVEESSESDDDDDEDSSASEFSFASLDDDDETTKRTERCAITRNPVEEETRNRTKSTRQKQQQKPIPAADEPIRSPRKSHKPSNRFIDGEVDDDSDVHHDHSDEDDSSFVSSSYYSSDSNDDDDESLSHSSSSAASEEYYTTSYDVDVDERHRYSTFDDSECWTEQPASSFGSEATERTNLTTSKRRRRHRRDSLSLLQNEDDDSVLESRSNMSQSRDATGRTSRTGSSLGSVDLDEFEAFVREQEAADKNELSDEEDDEHTTHHERMMESHATEEEEEEQPSPPSSSGNSGIFSWIFGETPPEPSTPKNNQKEEGIQFLDDVDDVHDDEETKFSTDKAQDALPSVESGDHSVSISGLQESATDGCVHDDNLVLVDGGESTLGSHGGSREGEFLRSSHCSSRSREVEDDASGRQLSVTMRGSCTCDEADDDIKSSQGETATMSQRSSTSNNSNKDSTVLSTNNIGTPIVPGDANDDTSSFLCCCFSPNHSTDEADDTNMPPSSGVLQKEFERVLANENAVASDGQNNDKDDETYASTINTEGLFQGDVESHPTDGDELSGDEDSDIEAGSYSRRDISAVVEANDDDDESHASTKRIKAESLENYDIAEIVHGKRPYKCKKTEDGVSPSPSFTPSELRERRKHSLRARNDLLLKSLSKDHSIENDEDAIASDDGSRLETEPNEQGLAAPMIGNNSSRLSNSIVPDDASIPMQVEKPDDLVDLVRNAFSAMMSSPTNDTVAPEVFSKYEHETKTPEEIEQPSVQDAKEASSPVDGALEVALRFFAPKNEESPLISDCPEEERGELKCMNFNPNPGVRTEKVKDSPIETKSEEVPPSDLLIDTPSNGSVSTSPSDEAVLKTSSSDIVERKPAMNMDHTRFNSDGIPLELRPKKIWRVFDSGFEPSPASTSSNDDQDSVHEEKQEQQERSNPEKTNPETMNDKKEQGLGVASNEKERKYDLADITTAVEKQMDKRDSRDPEQETEDKTEQPTQEPGHIQRRPARYRRRADVKRLRNIRLQQEKKSTPNEGKKDGEKMSQNEENVSNALIDPEEVAHKMGQSEKRTDEQDLPMDEKSLDEGQLTVPLSIGVTDANGKLATPCPSESYQTLSPPSKQSVSEIRSRIKQRRRSKLAEQRLGKQREGKSSSIAQPDTSTKRTTTSSHETKVKESKADRRDDVSDSTDHVEEFFDAVTFDEEESTEAAPRQVSGNPTPVLSLD